MNYYWQQNKKQNKKRKAFNNNLSTNLKLPKAQISKIIQSVGFLGRLFIYSFIKNRITINQNVIKLLAKSVLIPLGLAAAASAADAGIHK